MKTLLFTFAALALVASFSSMTLAAKEAPKSVTLTGSFTCGKCELKEAKKCHNVLIVEADGKKTTYWLVQNKVSRAITSTRARLWSRASSSWARSTKRMASRS